MQASNHDKPGFHIATIANRLDEYAAMKASFLQAGFTEPACRYTLLDNSNGNNHEPYSAINRLIAATTEPYLIVCHQDIRLDQGHGYERLTQLLAELTALDNKWAAAGNAGGRVHEATSHLVDPHGAHNTAPLPHEVYTLDENLLILRMSRKPAASPGLSGFHLYGADVCLNSMRQGYTSYIIDFRLTHLSGGSPESDAFAQAKQKFEAYWSRRFWLCLLKTTCTELTLSRLPVVRTQLLNKVNRSRVYNHINLYYKAANFANRFRSNKNS